MEFTANDKLYRVERGLSTGRWLLFEHKGPQVQWRLIDTYPAEIDDVDVIDRAKAALLLANVNKQV